MEGRTNTIIESLFLESELNFYLSCDLLFFLRLLQDFVAEVGVPFLLVPLLLVVRSGTQWKSSGG